MVVEIEGVQKIIRDIHKELSRAEVLIQGRQGDDEVLSFVNCIRNMHADCQRVVSLVLAETGHWLPPDFLDALHLAVREMAIKKEDFPLIANIACMSDELQEEADLGEEFAVRFFLLRDAVGLLCRNLSDYVVHTDLPT